MLILLLSVAALMPHVIAQSCHYQNCIGCQPEEIANTGTPVQCQIDNWVSPTWILDNAVVPPFPAIPPNIPIEYHCLEMVATPDNITLGNTIDIIRGCVPAVQATPICFSLVALQRLRDHNDVRCSTCQGNNCNSVSRIAAPLHFALFLPLLYFIVS